jgi:FG-GAP-like repeat
VAWAQQFRQGKPDRAALSKAAIERRLQSKHPQISADSSKPTPGKYLLGRAAARSGQLQSRIRTTSTARSRPQGATSGVFPGIQFRSALPAGAIANSVVVGDFNKDGHMDFVIANGGTNDLWIYLGNGDGTFQLPQIIPLTKGLTPVYIAAADLRGIGVLDLIVAEFDTSTIGVLLGNGDGTFAYEQEHLLPQPPGALVINDFNHDGRLDIVSVMVTLSSDQLGVQYLATLIGDGTGSFAAPMVTLNPGFYSTADSIASGDVNSDGFPDVLITGPGIENSQVYLNVGDGTFTPGATVIGNGPFNILQAGQLADVNGDGCLDAAVSDLNGDVWIAAGDCRGNFADATSVPMGDSNAAMVLADVNGDGHLDIVTTAIPLLPGFGDVAGNMLCVALGDGQGHFASGRDYVGTGMSYSLAIADFNGDGHPDVVSASPDTDTASVYLNDGSGGFGFPQGEWIGLPGVGVINAPISAPSFADVNGDGKPDVVILDEGDNGEYFITTMLNDGTGRFGGPVPSDAGVSLTSAWMGDYRLGNFRNTGHLDFVAIGLGLNYSEGTQYILFAPGNGDGTFGKPTFTAAPGADGEMGIGDFNGDGKLDFAAVGSNPNGAGWVVTIFLGNGDGTFRNAGNVPFTDSAELIARVFVGDFNRDGKPDIVVYDSGNGYWTTSSYVWEFLGNGNGTFQPGQRLFSAFQPMTMADVNGDSWLDIVRYDFFWPDGTTETLGPAKFTTYLGQPSGVFVQSSSFAPYGGVPEQAEPFAQFGDPMTSSRVGDLNGDGKPDEIAFQDASVSNGDVYAQVLMGNGDGTFTPTYDVFDFQKPYFFPGYSSILDGTTFSDLIEIDGATSSMHVFKGGPAPALQLALEQAQVSGTSGCGWVFLNLPSGSDTSVALSTSVAGVVLPASVTVPAGSLNQQFCYTLSSTYNWRQVFNIQAQLGTDIAIAYASQSYVVGFSETLSPSTDQVIYPTQSTTPMTVSLTSSQGYTSTVQLSCQGLPAGATCAFGSSTLAVSPNAVASTTVVIDTTASTQGTGPVLIVASDDNVSTRQSFNLTVTPLIVETAGNPTAATSPGTGTAEIVIVGIPPYSPSCSGLPSGATCTFSGNLDAQGDADIGVTVNVPSGVSPGAYPFTIQVASGPATAAVGITLSVTDFSLQAPSVATDWVPPGGTMNVSLTVLPINGFNANVNLTCSLDVGGTCAGGSFLIAGTAPNGINVAVSAPSGLSPGTHTLTVTAVSGPDTHTAAFPFYIADYSGSLSQSSLMMSQGASGSLTATINATAGFGGTVSFSCSGAAQISCSFSPSAVQPTASNSQTAKMTVTASGSASIRPLNRITTIGIQWLALMMPFGIVLVLSNKGPLRASRSVAKAFLMASILGSISCGGGSPSPGGGSSNSYNITVSATADGTNTTRTIGSLNLTVTN